MTEEKKGNYELNSHLHEEDKVETPAHTKPADSLGRTECDVSEVKAVCDSATGSCDQKHNGEIRFRDYSNDRHLNSVLEYANRIRSFVGFEEDSDEVPPPLPNPLVTSDADEENISDRNIDTNESVLVEDESNLIGNPDTGLLEPNGVVEEKSKTNDPDRINDDGNTNSVGNSESNLSGAFNTINCASDNYETLGSNKKDIIGDPVSVPLKGTESGIKTPSTMINNGFTDEGNINDENKDIPQETHIECSSNQLLPSQKTNNNSILKMENQTIENDSFKEDSNNNEAGNTTRKLKTDFEFDSTKIPDVQGYDNTGFENDNPASLKADANFKDSTKNAKPDCSASNLVCYGNDATSKNSCSDDLIADSNTSEIFSFDPDSIAELHKEDLPVEDKSKQTPDMAVLRRLSTEVVNKVLDEAGNQIREILDERKRSNIEINDLISNVEELMRQKSPEGNDTAEMQSSILNPEAMRGDLLNNARIPTKDENSLFLDNIPEHQSKIKNEIQLKDVLANTYDYHDFQRNIEKEMNKFDPRYDVDPDTVCGIGSFKPKWIQSFATAKTYLILYSIVGMLSGCYYTYLIGIISTLEKRFAFKSKISGTIMMVDEITPLFLGVLIGYFGGKTHKPRMVGLGMLLSATCCFVSVLPYFIYGPAVHLNILNVKNETRIELCDDEVRQENCDADDRPPTMAAVLFLMLGSFLKGFGNLAYYAIGLAYMDDNSKKKDTPIYFAVAMALRLIGPLLGFLLSSACLKFHENPFDDPGFGPDDPRWIGGWWMGFLLQGFLLLIFAIPISLFPRKLPGHNRPSENTKSKTQQNPVTDFAGLFAALKRLGKNPLYVFLVLNTIMVVFGAFGHYIMLPKYMENQFHLSASDASLLSGPPGLVAVMISTIIGGYLIWKFKPNPKILTAGMVTVEVIAAVGYLILMIPQCERVQMTNFGIKDHGLILDSDCNFNCNCSTAAFTPVCGLDRKTVYFSPCYAGCSDRSNQTFSNCSCISDPLSLQRDVTKGFCVSDGCWSQTLAFIITLPTLQMFVSLLRVSHTMILLRSIEPEDKSVALGTFETLLCALGFIPFPIVYGALVDSSCLIWESSCGKTGNCWFYDVDKFNYLLHGASAGFSSLSVLCLIVIFFLSGRVKDLYEEDKDVVITKEIKDKETAAIDQDTIM